YVAASFVAILAAALLAQSSDILTAQIFLKGARRYFEPYDAFYGIVKAMVFGFILTSISCYQGYRASGGAEGVGESATKAAVLSSVFILFADYILAEVLL
ncbi:MAG: ABC transporter permease, partial [Rhodothermales bacterium]